jgi:serine/threonine protein kinase
MSQPSRTDLDAESRTNLDAQSRTDLNAASSTNQDVPSGTELDDQATERPAATPPSPVPAVDPYDTMWGDIKGNQAAPALGTFGDYELLQEIARGGMGVVYKARQHGLERIVAIKMILAGQQASGEDVERFCLEARAAANLDHPNIVPIYEIGQHQGRHYFSMAFIEGDSLTHLVRDKGVVLSFKETATIVQAVANAIQYAHDHGIVHRDLKPENIMLDKHGRPRVTDFGLAKRQQVDSGLTAAGQVMGTPSYMAPEQAMGKSNIGPAADIYSLGAILYFLLTCRAPFLGSSVMETLFQVVKEDPVPPRQVNPSVPADLEAICLNCLQKDPHQRYLSAGKLAAALGAWASKVIPENSITEPLEDGIQATLGPHGSRTGAVNALRTAPSYAGQIRSPWLWVGIGTVLLACVIVAGFLIDWHTLLYGRPDAEHQPDTNQTQETTRVIQADGFTKPGKLLQEFGLKVELVGSNAGQDGVRTQTEGEKVSFKIEVDRDAYVGIWYINSDGQVEQLFPNSFEENHLFRAGKVYKLPGQQTYTMDTALSKGLDHIWVVASTVPWTIPEGERSPDNIYRIFHSPEEKEKWQRQLRKIILRPATPAEEKNKDKVAEEIIPFQVRAKQK